MTTDRELSPAHLASWLANRQRPYERLMLAFAAGVMSALGFVPIDAWPLTIAALAMLVWLLDSVSSLRSALAMGWWFGLGHMLLGLRWIAQAFEFQSNMPAWLGWVAVLLLSMLMAIYPAAAAGIAWRFRGALARVLALAGAWMLTEFLRGHLFGGFPWNPLGVIWLPLAGVPQAAAVIGALGLSGLMVLAGGALALAVRPETRPAATVIYGGLLAIGMIGAFRTAAEPQRTRTHVHLVQANIGQNEKWDPTAEETHLRRYLALSAQAMRDGRPAIVIWPEAAVLNLIDEEPVARARLASVLKPGDLLLTGGLKAIRDPATGEAIAARNSLFVLDSAGRVIGRYDKAELVPFGEYLPLRPLLTRIGLSRLAPGALDFIPGPGPRTLHLPGWPAVGPLICYEIIFPGQAVERGDRPSWILNASNDAWFSAAGAYMHMAQAQLRAIEEGLPVARATPTGISGLIDGHGRIMAALGRDRAGVVSVNLPPALPPTLFAHFGSIIPLIVAIMLILLAVVLSLRPRME